MFQQACLHHKAVKPGSYSKVGETYALNGFDQNLMFDAYASKINDNLLFGTIYKRVHMSLRKHLGKMRKTRLPVPLQSRVSESKFALFR